MRWIVYFRTIGHILPGPIHWCKICLKVPPWDTDSLRTNDRNLCQRVVVVRWSLQKLSQSMQFSTCWRENLCIFLFVTVCCFPYKCLHVTIYYFIFDNFEIWEGPRAIMGFYRASYDCICWVYNLKQFGDLLICWRPGDSIRLGRGRGNEVPKRGHVLQASTYYKTYEERMHMLKNVLWHLLEIYTTCSYFAL